MCLTGFLNFTLAFFQIADTYSFKKGLRSIFYAPGTDPGTLIAIVNKPDETYSNKALFYSLLLTQSSKMVLLK